MNNESEMYKVYDLIIDEKKSIIDLKKAGLSFRRIYSLLKKGLIIRTGTLSYDIPNYRVLMQYSEHLEKSLDYEKEHIVNRLLNTLYPHDVEILWLLARDYARKKDYKKTYESLTNILKLQQSTERQNSLIILNVLNYSYRVSKEIEEEIDELKKEELQSSPEKIDQNTKVYYDSLRGLLKKALDDLECLDYRVNKVYYDTIEILLKSGIKKKSEMEDVLCDLICEERYKEARDLIAHNYKDHNLTRNDKAVYYLLNVLIKIIDNNEIPVITPKNSYNVFGAIRSNDFTKALEFAKASALDKGVYLKRHPLYLLLNEIVKHLSKESEEKTEIEETVKEKIETIETDYERINRTRSLVNSLSHLTINEIDEYMEKLEIKEEDRILFKLLYAETSYENGNKVAGDKILKEVEKLKNKTSLVKELLERVKKDKKKLLNVSKSLNYK